MHESMEKIPFYVRLWLVLVVCGTLLMGLVYAAVQQDLRMTANDSPVQIVQEVTDALKQGADPQSIVPPTPTDLSSSLAAFVIIYDKNGQEVASSAELNGKTPALPGGVLATVDKRGDDRFTWAPGSGVREAVVVGKYATSTATNGYVLAGQSLRETEKHESQQLMLAALAWIVFVVVSFFACMLLLGGHESKHHHNGEHHKDHEPKM